jgi:hypothetical protein
MDRNKTKGLDDSILESLEKRVIEGKSMMGSTSVQSEAIESVIHCQIRHLMLLFPNPPASRRYG